VTLLGLVGIAVRKRAKPTVLAESLSARRVKALEYAFFAIGICAWAISTFLMIDGYIFGERTTGIATISLIVGVGCWTTFINVKRSRIRRF